MKIISIDVGIIHFGIILVTTDDKTFEIKSIDFIKLLNIKYNTCPANCSFTCKRTFAHYVYHVIEKHESVFNKADVILIETQPTKGFDAIPNVIQFKFPRKTIMQQPQSLHKFLGFVNTTYEERKEKIEALALADEILGKNKYFLNLKRKHDIGDAFMFVKLYLHRLKEAKEKKERQHKFAEFIFDQPVSANPKSK